MAPLHYLYIAAGAARIGRISTDMAETVVLGVLAWIVLIAVVTILWLFIVRWDLIDRFGIWWIDLLPDFWKGNALPTEKSRRQHELFVSYIKTRHSGFPFDESEFSGLPLHMRSDRFRRAWYALLGLVAASSIGIFGGAIIYVLTTAGDN